MAKAYTFDWFGDKVHKQVMSAAERGLFKGLEFVKQESVKIVPKDTGMLEKSASVKISNDGKQGAVSYDTPYAIRQHEELGYRHAEGRTAKYLEIPFQQNQGKALEIMAREIRRDTK